jgi:hypothetical protein
MNSQKSLTLDSRNLESVKYVSKDSWREMKKESVLVTERMYLKLIFQKKSEINIQGKLFLYRTIPLLLPEGFKLKRVKKMTQKQLLEYAQTEETTETNYKLNTYIGMSDKKKIIAFSFILQKEQSILSLCTEMKRAEVDSQYAMRIKDTLMSFLVIFILLLILREEHYIDIDLLDMSFWWIYALGFGIFWGMHRESLEAKCWYLAALRLNSFRESIVFDKSLLKSSISMMNPLDQSETNVHLELDDHICIAWYSAEISPAKILDLRLEDLEKDNYKIAFSIVSEYLKNNQRLEEQYDSAKEHIATLRAELSQETEKSRLGVAVGRSLAAENFKISLVEPNSNSLPGHSGSNLDITKLLLFGILAAAIIGAGYFALMFITELQLDIFSKVLIALGLIVAGLFVFLLIYKGRS